jgi:hypothetical protein
MDLFERGFIKFTLQIKNMTINFPLQILKTSGSNYDIGFQIGSRFKDKIKDALNQSNKLKFLRKEDESNPKKFDQLETIGKKHFPRYMEEIEGIAEGSGLEYRDITLMNFKYEYPEGCTTVVFKTKDRIFLGHNEDGAKENLENSFLVIANPKSGIPFFSFCYPGLLLGASFSFNSKGLVQTGNWMPTPDIKIGIPRHLIDRYVVEAENVNDALRRALLDARASGFSYNIASTEGRAVNLETTSQRHYVTEIANKYVHTNHYVSIGLRNIQQKIYDSTSMRYRQGAKMLRSLTSPNDILEILSSRENAPYSIFSKGGDDCAYTLCIALFEISNSGVYLKLYPPKQEKNENECMKFSLNDLK